MEVLPSVSTSRRPRISTLPHSHNHYHFRHPSASTSSTATFRFLTSSSSSSTAWYKYNFITPRQRKELRRTLSRKIFQIRKTIAARNTHLTLILLLILLFAALHFLLFTLRSHNKLTRQQNILYQTLTSPPPPLPESIVHPHSPNITICNSTNNCTSWSVGKHNESDLRRRGIYRDVRTIVVPLGATAYLYASQDGKLLVPFYPGKHVCEGNLVCGKLARLDVEAGLGQFLNYLEELGTVSNEWELARQEEIVYTYPAQTSFDVWDVTLIAQFSVNRLQRFEKLIGNWPGPLSAVIYLTEPSDANELVQYLRQPQNVERYSRVILTIVRPKYDRRGAHRTYPINRLRNLGISASGTDYYLVVDADFVPSPNLHSYATDIAHSSLLDRDSSSRKSPTALVIPCVAIPETYQGPYPRNVSDLSTLISEKNAYVTDPLAGHGPTFTTEILTETPLLTSRPYYEVCYETQWEPYYVLHKSAPRYDERFTNQGGDKQSHALLLNSLKYRFYVARDHFLYHLDHKNMVWPGGATFGIRDSVVGVPESDDDDEIEDGAMVGTVDDPFLALKKMKKKKKKKNKTRRFGYFSDTLSEIQSLFGIFYAWPRGCGQPFVHTQRIPIGGGLASGLF